MIFVEIFHLPEKHTLVSRTRTVNTTVVFSRYVSPWYEKQFTTTSPVVLVISTSRGNPLIYYYDNNSRIIYVHIILSAIQPSNTTAYTITGLGEYYVDGCPV